MTSDEKMTLRGTVVDATPAEETIIPNPTPMEVIARLNDDTARAYGDRYQLVGPRTMRAWAAGDGDDFPTGEITGSMWDLIVSRVGGDQIMLASLRTPASDPLGPIQGMTWAVGVRPIAVAGAIVNGLLGAIG